MGKNKKRRKNKFKNKNLGQLIKLLKRMNKREDALIEQIRDLEFYMATLEEDFFDEAEEAMMILGSESKDDFVSQDLTEEVTLHTMDQVLEALEEPKKKKKKKKKK